MALQKWGQKDSGQYSVYNPLLVTWIYWELEVISMKHIHIRQDKDGEIR